MSSALVSLRFGGNCRSMTTTMVTRNKGRIVGTIRKNAATARTSSSSSSSSTTTVRSISAVSCAIPSTLIDTNATRMSSSRLSSSSSSFGSSSHSVGKLWMGQYESTGGCLSSRLSSIRNFSKKSKKKGAPVDISFGDGDDDGDVPAGRRKKALVLGSSGALGSAVSRYMSQQFNYEVLGADVSELPSDLSGAWELDGFIQLPRDSDLPDQTLRLLRGVDHFLSGRPELDVVVCASGGWMGDPTPESVAATAAAHPSERAMDTMALSYAKVVDDMIHMNLYPVVAAGYVAQYYMARDTFGDGTGGGPPKTSGYGHGRGGLVVVIGATPALGPTPGMMGYGLSKAAAHHVVKTLGATAGTATSVEGKSLRQASKRVRLDNPALESLDSMTVLGILPTTIDTPNNRRAMPDANFKQWTRPIDIAKEITKWTETPSLRPHSGSLIKVSPSQKGDGAVFQIVR